MSLTRRSSPPVLALLVLGLAFSSPARGCDIPVFRYALERWSAGLYYLLVVSTGPLSPEEKTLLERLEHGSEADGHRHGYELTTLDAAADAEGAAIETLRKQGIDPADRPVMVLYHPEERRVEEPVWHGALTPENVEALIDSPARREIARRIVGGDCAVWVFVESGDRTEDGAAGTQLTGNLDRLAKDLRITADGEDGEGWYQPGLTGTEVEVSFSSVTVSRDDPKEAVFIATLMGVEPDLAEYAEYPMAFPVFGRGRALYALVGKGINEDNIEEACAFLTGPCSCEAKALNPGADLLMTVDWDRMLDEAGSTRVASVSQPLVGLSTLAEAAADPDEGDVTPRGPPEIRTPLHRSLLPRRRPERPFSPSLKPRPARRIPVPPHPVPGSRADSVKLPAEAETPSSET